MSQNGLETVEDRSNHHRDRGPEVVQVLVELLPGTLSGVDVTVADDSVAAETVLPAD